LNLPGGSRALPRLSAFGNRGTSIGSTTIAHTLESSHSPFLSQQDALSKILVDISVQSLANQRGSAIGIDK
jgi:hypothetical protein